MLDIQIQAEGYKEVQTYLSKIADTSTPGAKKIMQNAAFSADARVKQNATNILKVRSGNLKRSISTDVSGNTIKTLRASVYAAARVGAGTVVYAPTHEYGGTITAKNAYKGVPGGPYLNIPADANKTPAGVMRQPARLVFAAGGYVAGRVVYSRDDEPMFYLVKSVTIKARLGMRDAVDAQIPTMLQKLAEDFGGE